MQDTRPVLSIKWSMPYERCAHVIDSLLSTEPTGFPPAVARSQASTQGAFQRA